jgi:sterol desaturase/sphingolipid hydroxylase (fatty acid hydroxylase superfamily)
MHHKYKGFGLVYKRHTGQHHRFFDDNNMLCESTKDYKIILFPPILLVFFLFGFALPIAIILQYFLSPNVAKLFMLTAVFYYLNYEILHLSYHLPNTHILRKLPIVNRLSNLHTVHHKTDSMQKHNFNITYPIFDIIFGTYKK